MFVNDINRRRDGCPHAKADSLLTVIGHVNNAVINTTLAEGTMFRSDNHYAEGSMFRPLESIQDLMESFSTHVERWAFRVKFLDHLDPEITRIHKARNLYDALKFSKINRRLDKVGPIDDHYCSTFAILSDELSPVVEELESLAKLLDTVCSEGNFLQNHRFKHHVRSRSSVTTIHEDEELSNSPVLPSNDSICPASSITIPSPPLATAPVSFPPTRAQNPESTTPTWKIALSERYPLEALFVGATELNVFSRVLAATRAAKNAVEDARKLCQDRGQLASDMQQVFEAWSQKCDDWKEYCIRCGVGNRNAKLRRGGRRTMRPSHIGRVQEGTKDKR